MIDGRDAAHAACVAAVNQLRLPLVTTWPAFTQAMYFLGAAAGWNHQRELWRLTTDEVLAIHATPAAEQARIQELMQQYRDLPMDLADASLVAAAESIGLTKILTLDADFLVYRTRDGGVMDVIRPVG
jgi:predicted nucleic acid-binding protein